jgi:LPS export ABC transporter protein LptC
MMSVTHMAGTVASMKWYGFVLVCLLIGGVVLYRIGERGDAIRMRQAVPSQSNSQPQSPHSQMQGIKLIEQADQSTAWEILAAHAEFSEHANLVVVREVHAQLFQDHIALISVEADRSIVQRDTGNITMQGQVRVRHQDGYIMTTKTLDWLAKARQLHTDEAVELEGPSVYITGIGLQSDVDQQRFHLEHNVHASFRLR